MQKHKIHLISGPRNISTALMYSFGNRDDMDIVDEPFYAYYLDTHPEIIHPGRAATLESLPTSYKAVLSEIIKKDYSRNVFFKNMAQHLDKSDWEFIKGLKNLFLIREPRQLIASFAQVIPEPTMLDIGLELEWELFQYASDKKACAVVVDSNDILKDPARILPKVCCALDLPFSEKMLKWTAGPRKEDGVWAKYWYKNVHRTTGFQKQKTSSRDFPDNLQPLLNEAQTFYNSLAKYAIKVEE